MTGETPTTVLAATAARMPGTARMVPMLTTGFDGGNTITSASPMASSTPGAGAAPAAPTAVMATAGVCACMRTHHSWKCTVRRSSSTTCVSIGSSDIGSSRTPGCHRSHSTRVTADRD